MKGIFLSLHMTCRPSCLSNLPPTVSILNPFSCNYESPNTSCLCPIPNTSTLKSKSSSYPIETIGTDNNLEGCDKEYEIKERVEEEEDLRNLNEGLTTPLPPFKALPSACKTFALMSLLSVPNFFAIRGLTTGPNAAMSIIASAHIPSSKRI